jgi:hypothetical protein
MSPFMGVTLRDELEQDLSQLPSAGAVWAKRAAGPRVSHAQTAHISAVWRAPSSIE